VYLGCCSSRNARRLDNAEEGDALAGPPSPSEKPEGYDGVRLTQKNATVATVESLVKLPVRYSVQQLNSCLENNSAALAETTRQVLASSAALIGGISVKGSAWKGISLEAEPESTDAVGAASVPSESEKNNTGADNKASNGSGKSGSFRR